MPKKKPAYAPELLSLEAKLALLKTVPGGGIASALPPTGTIGLEALHKRVLQDWPLSTNIEEQTPEELKWLKEKLKNIEKYNEEKRYKTDPNTNAKRDFGIGYGGQKIIPK